MMNCRTPPLLFTVPLSVLMTCSLILFPAARDPSVQTSSKHRQQLSYPLVTAKPYERSALTGRGE
jgi:hypothetical protein